MVNIPRVSSVLLKSACQFILPEAVTCRLSISSEKCLWSGSNTRLPNPCPDDSLTDFIASFYLGLTKYSIAVITASYTVISTVVVTLSTSLRTLLTKFFSSVYISITGCGSTVLFKEVSLSAALALLSVWSPWLLCPIMKTASDSLNWLRNLFFWCFFFRVEAILKSTVELTNGINQIFTKEEKVNVDQYHNNKSVLNVLKGTCYRSLFFPIDFPPGSIAGCVLLVDIRFGFQ